MSRQILVIRNSSLEEIDDFFMRAVFRPVAGNVEGGETGCVFAELVAPEIAVRLVLRNPEFVHRGQEVEFTEGGEEG